jgi:pimeloyl-ACP methyl ester carboxylesterase
MHIRKSIGHITALSLLMASLAIQAATGLANSAPRQIDLRIDVTGKVNLSGKIEIAATAYLPDVSLLGPRPVVLFALPGGGLTRHYFDLRIPGHGGYSEAAHHTARGIILVAIDHLGVGDSTVTAMNTMHIEDIAQADDAAVREISQRLMKGTLAPGFPALPLLFRIGIGQSMGGGITIIMQGRYRTYDAIAPLGYSAVHTVLPQPTEADRLRIESLWTYHNGRWADPKTLSFDEAAKARIDYLYFELWDDVPQDIRQMHGDKRASPPDWLSKTLPTCVIGMLSPGYVATEAAEITVPVFIGLGERDVVPNPFAEPAAYQSTRDITVFIVPRLAHTHNLGGSRKVLWDRLVNWARTVSQTPAM